MPNVNRPMAQRFTTPWSVLDWIKGARTRAREIQAVHWRVKTTEGSSLRVLYRGDTDVPLQENMASTQGSVT